MNNSEKELKKHSNVKNKVHIIYKVYKSIKLS